MLVLMGTYPGKDPKIIEGPAKLKAGKLVVSEEYIEISSGTIAMAAAVTSACAYLDIEPPYCVFSGDLGTGEGSRNLYSYLKDDVFTLQPDIIVLHYIMPMIDEMVEFGFALEDSNLNPILIADAGGMYGAKISGLGHIFHLFTPDMGELAFLADPDAPHPMFVNENLYSFSEDRIPELIQKVVYNEASPDILIVKGSIDYIVQKGTIIDMIDSPDIPAMEAVGGTGDTLTGIAAALIYYGNSIEKASGTAARVNRIAGKYCNIKPDSSITGLIEKIPQALGLIMEEQTS